MENKNMVIGLLVLVIGLIGGYLLGKNTSYFNVPGNSHMMGGNEVMSTIDEHFIEQMISHHEEAAVMANLALTMAENQETKKLSTDIITAQTREINQMKDWYTIWFGEEGPLRGGMMGRTTPRQGMMMGMGMMGDDSDTQRLETAKPFDKAFIEEMIPHHQMAVMMAEMLRRITNRQEMKQLADDIITSQTNEINDMREWYSAWYR